MQEEITRGPIDILKQSMNNPDYAARQEYFGKASPARKISAIQE